MKNKILSVRISDNLYKKIEKRIAELNLQRSEYIRKITELELDKKNLNLSLESPDTNNSSQKAVLETNLNELSELYEELSTKYHRLKNKNQEDLNTLTKLRKKNSKLHKLNETLFDDLLFLMNFFQDYRNYLLKNKQIQSFFKKNTKKFQKIAQKFNEE